MSPGVSRGRQTLIHVARAHATSSSSVVERAGREQLAAVETVRPRRTRRAACRSQVAGRCAPRSGRARTAPSGRSPLMYMTKLLGQSSAAHKRSARNQPVGAGEIGRVLDRRGEQFARDPTRPGCTRNPSPGARSGPQTKQRRERDASRDARRRAMRPPRPVAAASDGGAGASTSTIAGTASAIVASPSRRTSTSPAAASTVQWRLERRRAPQRDSRPDRRSARRAIPRSPHRSHGRVVRRTAVGNHDRLDDHRVMMTDARLGAIGCGASVGRPASVD